MPLYRKKPVVIEAVRYDETFDMAILNGGEEVYQDGGQLAIKTLEGTMRADPGDWIIRGVQGELYPCKPDIFAATYEDATAPLADSRAEVARLREALERIALGINGRRDDGLRPSEMDSTGMAKTDWMLAQAVLASGLSS